MSFMCGVAFSFLSHDFTFCWFVCSVDIVVGNVVESFSVEEDICPCQFVMLETNPLLHLFCESLLHCNLLLYYTKLFITQWSLILILNVTVIRDSCRFLATWSISLFVLQMIELHIVHFFLILSSMVSFFFFFCSCCFSFLDIGSLTSKQRLFLPLLFCPLLLLNQIG